jgi:hypothetical protein
MIAALENNQLALSLISGLIGSLIGAIIGGFITFLITRYSLNKTAELTKETLEKSADDAIYLEQKKRRMAVRENLDKALLAFYAECIENRKSIKRWKEYRTKFRFSNDAWNNYKLHLVTFSKPVQEDLIRIYTEIARWNTLIDYDVNISPGLGTLDAALERQMGEVEIALASITEELQMLVQRNIKKDTSNEL